MQSKDIFVLALGAIGTILGLVNIWLGFIRRGRLRMTEPALIAFLFDLPKGEPKVFFRALLYSTGKRGQMIESMFLRVRRGETSQTFNFWAYGEKSLLPGSGLRVGEDGVAANHHFLPPRQDGAFRFLPGEYAIEVYASVVNRRAPIMVRSMTLRLADEQAEALTDSSKGLLYTWSPDSKNHIGHVDVAPRLNAADG
jgi:hypothetical protein